MGLVDGIGIEFFLLGVQSIVFYLSVLLAVSSFVLALRLDSCDVETLAGHDCHILRCEYIIIVIVLIATLILRAHTLLLLLAIGLHPYTLALIRGSRHV